MALWVVRAGKHGEQQEVALNQGLICHNWNEVPDCTQFRNREELRQLYKSVNPTQSEMQVNTGVGQVWRFAREIRKGDLVALALKTESSIAFGRVVGDYEYKQHAPNVFHTRRVEWLKTVARSELPDDVLLSMGSLLTVFKVNRNEADNA